MCVNCSIHRCMILIAAAGLMIASGCQSTMPAMSSIASNPFQAKAASPAEPEIEYQSPARMAVIWRETTVSAPGAKSTRGFGGRVYFYDGSNETVRVDGDLIVYAYDDSNHSDDQSRVPDRKYVFRASDLQKRHSVTGLGDSYNIWLPWDKIGGERKTIALVPIFKPKEGMMPKSDHSIAVLSGKTPTSTNFTQEQVDSADSQIRQVAMTVPAGARNQVSNLMMAGEDTEGESDSTVRTSTFEVPRSLANRMNRAKRPAVPKKRFVDNKSTTSQANNIVERTSGATPVQSASAIDTTPQPVRSRSFGQPGSFR